MGHNITMGLLIKVCGDGGRVLSRAFCEDSINPRVPYKQWISFPAEIIYQYACTKKLVTYSCMNLSSNAIVNWEGTEEGKIHNNISLNRSETTGSWQGN